MIHDKIQFQFVLVIMILTVSVMGCKKNSEYQEKQKPELIIRADDPRLQSQTIHFFKDTVYIIAVNLQRDSGQTLEIDAGTLVKVNNKMSITMNVGSTIEAKGTQIEPIVFTSSAARGGAGAGSGTTGGERWWYGIRIYGNSLTGSTRGSGTLTYVRIEFAGGNENFSNLPSLLLKNTTKETIIENVQVSYSFKTPSFEISGGNCNASNLLSYASGSTDFYLRDGYIGLLQHLIAYRHPYFPSSRVFFPSQNLAGLLITGTGTFPALSNVTVIGPDLQKGTLGDAGVYSDTFATGSFNSKRVASLVVTGGSKFRIRNSIFLGFPKGGFYLDDRNSALSLESKESEFSFSSVHSNDSARVFFLPPNLFPGIGSKDFKALMLQPEFSNQIYLQSDAFMLTNPFNYDGDPDPMPRSGAPILSGANFDGAIFSIPFFKKVNFRGALGTDNWLHSWVNFIPLQTDYNK
jgi:hypothetical protein